MAEYWYSFTVDGIVEAETVEKANEKAREQIRAAAERKTFYLEQHRTEQFFLNLE